MNCIRAFRLVGPRFRRRAAIAWIGLAAAGCSIVRREPDVASLVDGTHPITAYLIVRAADCDTHLATLHELEHEAWRERITIGGVIVSGPASDSVAVRRALESYDLPVPVVARGDPRYEAIRRLGARDHLAPIPSLLLLDSAGRLTLTRGSPATLPELFALRADIARLMTRFP
jgi:hypothetical protein